jgi:hypothetical protein
VFAAPTRWSQVRRWILTVTAVYLAGGLVIGLWDPTTELRWLVSYTRGPGALLLVSMAIAGFWFSYRVSQQFSPGEPLLTGWRLIALSGAFDTLGAIVVQILAVDSVLNPLTVGAWWSPGLATDIGEWGRFMGGPCRMLVLAAGLLFVLEVYRRSGFLARLLARDWIIVGAMTTYVLAEAWAVYVAIKSGKQPGLGEILHYPTDPLLLLLLGQALLLYRSVGEMGAGWVGRCWKAFSIGVILISIGDLLSLAEAYGHIQWPWSAIDWFVWYPAAAVFAAAPTFQLEAMMVARGRQNSK